MCVWQFGLFFLHAFQFLCECVCVCWLTETELVITLIGFKVARTQDTAQSSPERETETSKGG